MRMPWGALMALLMSGGLALADQGYERYDVIGSEVAFNPGEALFHPLLQQITNLLIIEREYLDQRLNQTTHEGDDVDQRLNQTEARLKGSVEAIMTEKVGTLQTKIEQGLERMAGEITGLETRLAAKIEEAEAKMEAMQTDMTNQLSRLATQEGLMQLKSKLSTAFISTVGQVSAAIEGLVTVAKMEELLAVELGMVGEVCDRCGKEETLVEVSAAVLDLQTSLPLLTQHLENTVSTCSQGCETIGQEVSRLGDDLAASTLNESVTRMELDLAEIHTSVGFILNLTIQADLEEAAVDTTAAITTTITPPLELEPDSYPILKTPCEDSHFVLSKIDVCAAAVRFRKCHVTALSYHCCHTCFTAGRISDDGPWRYFDYPRVISPLQAFQLLRRQ